MASTGPDGAGSRTGARTKDDGLVDTVRHVADSVAGAAGDVTARLPEVAQTTRETFSEANRLVQRGSDDTLRLVGAAAVGFSVGLLVGGANRLLVIASMVPAAMIAATMVERSEGGAPGAIQRATERATERVGR
ncbi:MAG: hypothetical protein ACLGIJ_06970 [Candidatus Limnocylindria bacterium]